MQKQLGKVFSEPAILTAEISAASYAERLLFPAKIKDPYKKMS
ncbi:hypothetical protein [Acinetobacter sp.]